MTVQTQTHPGIRTRSNTKVRGIKGFAIGFAALAAAATGIGFAVSGTTEAPTTVIAPVSEADPAAEQREALQRLHEDASKSAAATEPEVVWYLPGKPGIK